MRQIDSTIKSRISNNLQTVANNNNPTMQTVVSRPLTPIFNKRFWQETIVTAGANATCTSVAVRKTGKLTDRIFVAYVAGGTLIVKSAAVTYPIDNMAWNVEQTVLNCVACAIEFDGLFVRAGRDVEFRTESIPWLFYTTTAGELKAGILGGSFETLAASGASTIDVVRGIASLYKDIDQGLIVFYILNNAVYYRQRIAGAWQGQQQVGIAPANPVSIKVERLFDYRICLQITDAAGALWEVFTKMEASGWNGTEYISLSLSYTAELININYRDFCADENITLSLSQESKILYALSPIMVGAENIDDGAGNDGLKIQLTWDENVFGYEEQAENFIISDGAGGAWGGQSITKNGKILTITFMDFNNAINPVTLTYTPGNMTGDIAAVVADSIQFNATGLISNQWPKPAAVMAKNIDEIQIIVSFDMLVESVNWAANADAFTVAAQEYDMIPGGTTLLKTYVVSDVTGPVQEETNKAASMEDATLTNAVLVDGAITLQ